MGIYSRIALLSACAVAFIAIMLNAVLGKKINLAPHKTLHQLETYGQRLQFVLEYQSLAVFNMVLCMLCVVAKRWAVLAFNPLESSTETHVIPWKNILTNNVEQTLLSLLIQLSMVGHCTSLQLLQYVPLLNLLNVIGRVFFILGYPSYRTFGFVLIFVPNMCGALFTMHKFLLMLKLM